MTPVDLYRACRVSGWRIEALQHYDVPSDEARQQAFHAGETLPPPGPGKLDDLKLITELVQSGRHAGRVHIVDRPLSDYVRYELAAYEENVAAGEKIWIADRSLYPELEAITADFALFDLGTEHPRAVMFDYSESGRVLGYRIEDDLATIAECAGHLGLAQRRAVPLAEFTAASRAA